MTDDEIIAFAKKLGWPMREDFKYGLMIFRRFPPDHVPVSGETVAWSDPQALLDIPEFVEAVARLKAE